LSATMVSFKLILTHLRLVLILNSEVEWLDLTQVELPLCSWALMTWV
jgi:hypothetical protein